MGNSGRVAASGLVFQLACGGRLAACPCAAMNRLHPVNHPSAHERRESSRNLGRGRPFIPVAGVAPPDSVLFMCPSSVGGLP